MRKLFIIISLLALSALNVTADEMMAILAQENTEGQVQVTPQEKKADENAVYDKVEQPAENTGE